MNDQLEKDFQSRVKLIKDKTNVLHFSTGADSIACYLRLKEHGINPVLVYHYYLKDLPMVKNYIDYFEKKFNEHVYQFSSTLWANDIDNALYQYPKKAREKFRNSIGQYALDMYTKDDFDHDIKEAIGGDVVIHLGLRYTDGLRRYQHLMKHGVMYNDKFYPIAPFQIKDIQAILEKYNVLLPIEYGLWGISFESPRSWNINLIKTHCPETYKALTKVFPLCGLLGARDKYSYLNRHFKSRLTQFSKFAMKKEMYPVW
jgi:hypothetical protein